MRLVYRGRTVPPPRQWAADVARVFGPQERANGWAPWHVLGGPGTGKTALLTDIAVDRIGRVGDPESALMLTHSRRAAADLREAVAAGLLGTQDAESPRATREPLVRTVHSYAFAVLRLQAAAHGNPPPRLMTGAEQDSVLREMLRGDVEDGALMWPERLRPALSMAGFAAELRDLMLRASERGIGPEDLIRLGRKHSRQEWVSAGKFAVAYEQATLLRWAVGVEAPEATAPALDAAELVGAALTALVADPDLLARERARVRCLLVDDAQHLDPQAAALIRLVGAGADLAVIAGDPDQAVFGFRGADSRFLLDAAEESRRIVLGTNHRSGARIGKLNTALTRRLPGLPPHRDAEPSAAEADDVRIRVLPTAAKEAALIADTLRRAHLVDGIAWSQMAVIVRSVPLSIAPLRRALSAAGVPMGTAASELPLARQRGCAWLLLVLRAVARSAEFSGDDALALVSGPVGGADPVALRRLRRGLRRAELAAGGQRESMELLRQLMIDGDDVGTRDLTDVESAPLRKVNKVLGRARIVLAQGRGAEEVLWAAWQSSGLERRWAAASARGGPVGAQADRDLDAAVALFDAAADYVDRLPRSTVDGFVDYVEQQQIPVDAGARAAVRGEAVTIVSAHSAAGREWDVVAVAGVQEGIWPSLRGRGSVLGTDVLVELSSGIGEPGDRLSRTAPLLADERRLLLVACSRARRSLLITAVQSASGDRDLVPSRFVDELIADFGGEKADSAVDHAPQGRVLALPALVAELRSVVCDLELRSADPAKHARATAQLARLAAAGVKGAHPDQWYGLGGASTDRPLWDPADGPVPLSPSTVELLRSCPLRWALERNGGSEADNVRAVAGTLVHTLVQAVAGRVPDAQIQRALDEAWESIELGSQWFSRQELQRTRTMLQTFSEWLGGSRAELTEAGVEVGVDATLDPRDDGGPAVRIRGRIDRLERDPDGRLVIVDVKAGKNPVTAKDAQQHAQLATYQVAAAAGGIAGEATTEPGGGRLVYVAKKHNRDGATQRTQAALDADGLAQWRDTIHDAAAATKGPHYLAIVNDGCRHCPVSDSCPAQDSGRQVTDG